MSQDVSHQALAGELLPEDASPAQRGATQRNNGDFPRRNGVRKDGDANGLSQRQFAAIEMMLRGLGDAEVGQRLGVDRGTVYRWRTGSPAFHVELERQRRRSQQQSSDRLRSMVPQALDILQQQLVDPKTALRAAAILLRLASARRGGAGAELRAGEDERWAEIEAYINAPMPTAPPYVDPDEADPDGEDPVEDDRDAPAT